MDMIVVTIVVTLTTNNPTMNTTPLTQYYQTLPSIDSLIGLRVENEDGELLYIVSVEDGIFCSDRVDSDTGHYYRMRELNVVVE